MSYAACDTTNIFLTFSSDPQHLRTDAELISVLQRTWLLPQEVGSDPITEAKFNLDASIGDEG